MRCLAAAQRVEDIIDEIEQLIDQDAGIDLLFLAEIDEMAVDAIPTCAPFILVDKGAGVHDKVEVLRAKFVDLHTDGLEEGGDTDGLVHRHGDIADAELHRIEEGMDAEVPPDL